MDCSIFRNMSDDILERRISFIEDEIENEENPDRIAELIDELRCHEHELSNRRKQYIS